MEDDGDCDDAGAEAYPRAADTWYDGVDSDCAGDSDHDADGDGYGSDEHGGTDCDDTDASVTPAGAGDSGDTGGAVSLCDYDCTISEGTYGTYATCADATDWTSAEVFCGDLGGSLVAISSAEEDGEVMSAAASVPGESNWWWIGFCYQYEDEACADWTCWSNGESVAYDSCRDCDTETAACAVLEVSSEAWADAGKTNAFPFICEL